MFYLTACIPLLFSICALSLTSISQGAAAESGVENPQFDESTLAEIYELAVENDQTIAQARAIYRVGAEERVLARSRLLPKFNVGYAYQESESENRGAFPAGAVLFPNRTDTQADTNVWNISLSQPLFDLPAWFGFQQGVQLSREAEAAFAVAQQDLVLRVAIGYFEVMRAMANLRASRAQESALKAQLDQVQQRFVVGLVAVTDLHEAHAGHDLAVSQRITDEGQLGISLELLSVLTGQPNRSLWVLKPSFPVLETDPPNAEAWVDFAKSNNLDIRVAKLARNAAEKRVAAAKSEHLPKINIAASYRDANTDVYQKELISSRESDFPNNQKQSIVYIELTMPLYAGGYISANRRQAVARLDTQEATYAGTVRDVIQETRAVHISVLSEVARNKARARAVISTKSALDAAEVGFEVGTRNAVDVLRAQETYFSAIRDYDNSIVDYVQNLLRLKRLVGTLAPEDIYEIDGWLERPPMSEMSVESAGDRRSMIDLDPNQEFDALELRGH